MIPRLRKKFVCINMVLMTVMLVLIFAMQYHSTQASLEETSMKALQAAAMEPMMSSRPDMLDRGAGQPCFILQEGVRGEILVSGDSYYDLSDTETLQKILQAVKEDGRESGVLERFSLRFYRTENLMGTRYVFTDITSERQTLQQLVKSYVLIGIAAFVGFLVIGILLARWAVRPVEKAWQQQRQFVADASHELKTPLTVILTNAELLEDPDCDGETRQRLTGSILSMSRQMRGLVENLLQLARVDNGQISGQMERLDLGALVEESILPFEPAFFEQGLMLECRVQPDIAVTGNASRLTQLVDILLDNAQKYSAPGSLVELELYRHGRGHCMLALHSPGQPLTQQQCRDIFKRFYRVEESRTTAGSYGLGLAIAQGIVQDHRGRIWAEPRETGNVFFVSLPMA